MWQRLISSIDSNCIGYIRMRCISLPSFSAHGSRLDIRHFLVRNRSDNPLRLSMRSFATAVALRQEIKNDEASHKQTISSKSSISSNRGNNEVDRTLVDKKNNNFNVTFIRPDGSRISVKASQGKTLYDAVIDNNVDIDGFGACEGTLCCTTCHLILKKSDYDKIGEPRDEELDMLDLAYGLTDTSRLGCQVTLTGDLDPLEVQVPASINDVRES